MRVLNVQLRYTHGGNPQVCIDYTRILKESGNEVFVLTNPADPFINQHHEIADGVIASKKLGKLGPYDIFSMLYFKRLIKDINPDVIIAHEGRSAALLKRVANKSNKVIDVNHGRSPKQSRKLDATILINKAQVEDYKNFFSDSNNSFYVQNSINLDGHIEPVIPRAWNDVPVIGTIGRMVKDKALDVFVDALAILQKRGVKFAAKMAGDGEEAEEINRLIIKNGLHDKVLMTGWAKNPDEFYNTIDIFCFPSRKESFGLVLLEAYKHGLPVVVSDAEGPSHIVEPGKDALMVPAEDAESLANALQELLENKEKADSLAQAGYEKLSKYSTPAVAKCLQEVLRKVVIEPNKKTTVNTARLTRELFAYSKL